MNRFPSAGFWSVNLSAQTSQLEYPSNVRHNNDYIQLFYVDFVYKIVKNSQKLTKDPEKQEMFNIITKLLISILVNRLNNTLIFYVNLSTSHFVRKRN